MKTKKLKTKSRFFETIEDIDRERKRHDTDERKSKLDFVEGVRRFMAGLSQYQEGVRDEKCDDDEEITNYLVGLPLIQKHRSFYSDIISKTNTPVQVKCENKGDIAMEARDGRIITKALNKHVFKHGKEWSNFIMAMGDAELLHGVSISMCPEKWGWIPEINNDMIFPCDTKMETKDLLFWWKPVELTARQLEEYSRIDEDDGDYINSKAIKSALEEIEDTISSKSSRKSKDYANGLRDYNSIDCDMTFPAYWYYEVDKEGKLNRTLYITKQTNYLSCDTEIMFLSGEDGLLVEDYVDFAEVSTVFGGDNLLKNAVGYVQLIYPFSEEQTELLNMAADNIVERLTNKFTYDSTRISEDQIAEWDPQNDIARPDAIKRDVAPSNQNDVFQLMGILGNNSSQVMNSNMGINGQQGNRYSSEVKEEFRERQGNQTSLEALRKDNIISVYRKAVVRIFRMFDNMDDVEDTKPYGWEGIKMAYDEIKAKGVDISEYTERVGSRFKYVTVSIDHVIAPGDPSSFQSQADSLMAKMQYLTPAARQMAIWKLIASDHGADYADELMGKTSTLSETVRNQQDVAWLKMFKVERKALNGQRENEEGSIEIGTNPWIHVMVAFENLEAWINKKELGEPWTAAKVLQTSGVATYAQENIEFILDQGFGAEAKLLHQELQQFMQVLGKYAAEVDMEQEQQGSSDAELKMLELQARFREVEVKEGQLEVAKANLARLSYSNNFNDQLKAQRRIDSNMFQANQQRITEQGQNLNKQ